ncbi:IS3 family transposase [Paraburkholderia sp. LEh10]|nr:IS3 family transposase [Paraburkholderia sp. LEh10]
MQVPRGKDLGKARIGSTFDGGHASRPDRSGPLRLAEENPVVTRSVRNDSARLYNPKAYDRNLRVPCRYPNTSRKHAAHKIWPYLLRDRKVDRSNQVWALDTTYVPMARGFVYLTAVVDWASRRVLAHRVAITLEAEHAVAVLEEAFARYGQPEIVNTDQGSQFTSDVFTETVLGKGVRLSMDGKGSWRDNVFVERLWRSVKYEEVYLKAYESVSQARESIAAYMTWYNRQRPHSSLTDRTPDEAYFAMLPAINTAA